MEKNFEKFMSQLIETNATLDSYSEFEKIRKNVDDIAISLNMLNFLLGKEDLRSAVEALWDRDKKVFDVLDILIATRRKDKKKYLDNDGEINLVSSLFTSVDGVMKFFKETGLAEVFQNKDIHDLVDYVFGVETGLDSNARKNRGGHIMEGMVANILSKNNIKYRTEVCSNEWPEITSVLGDDKKRFDFVVRTTEKIYLIEVNFYSGGGSKLNDTARSYSDIAPKINSVPGFEFVWITDGVGWKSARNKLQEAYSIIPSIYNLTDINDLLETLCEK